MIAIVTGANRGLGREISFALWHKGYSLILIGRSKSQLLEIKTTFEDRANQSCEIIICDLSDDLALCEVIKNDISNYKKIDVLINNAAIHGPIDIFNKTNSKELKNIFQVNFFSPFALTKAVIPLMKKYGGSVINISGGGAAGPRPYFSAYAASKAALVRFSETVALELKENNIRVNCVAPGMMPTKLLSETIPHIKNTEKKELDAINKVLTDKSYSYANVIELILFLSSASSKNISGKLISAVWDNWQDWNKNILEINKNDLYTLRRITAKDKGFDWGDK